MESVKKHLVIEGRVQGVGFRHFTRTKAREAGVRGWVRNRADGTVEALLEAESGQLSGLVDQLREGPPASRVDRIEVNDAATDESFVDFRIRR